MCIVAVGTAFFTADALPLAAQSPDELALAIPVRKGSGSSSESSTSGKPATEKRGGSTSRSGGETASVAGIEADLAAVHYLRSDLPPLSGADSASDGTEDRGEYELDDRAPATAPGRQPDAQGPTGESSTEMVAVPGPTALAPMATVQAAERAQPRPNLYLPQPEEQRGFLSRIFRRRSSAGNAASAPAPTQDYFNSDYATRGNAVLPAVIRGNGYNGSDLPIGGEDSYRLASLPANFCPTDLVQLPVQLCHYGNQLYLRQEAAASLCNMINAAAMQGLNIKVVSAYRDIGHQTRLYNQAVARRGPDQKMVAKPGKSEHNLGTTVDVTNSEQHTLKRSFGDTAEGRWLAANAHRFGWKMTVMSGNGRRSHNDEPWHLRYLGSTINGSAPISVIAQQQPRRQRRDVFGSIGRFLGLRN